MNENTSNLEEHERIVRKFYPMAFAFVDSFGGWSICNGTRTFHGNIRIANVGFHEKCEAAWQRAAQEVSRQLEPIEY